METMVREKGQRSKTSSGLGFKLESFQGQGIIREYRDGKATKGGHNGQQRVEDII